MTENDIIELCCAYCYTLFFGIRKEGDDICFDCLARLESIDGVPLRKWLEGGLDDYLKEMKKEGDSRLIEGDEECT